MVPNGAHCRSQRAGIPKDPPTSDSNRRRQPMSQGHVTNFLGVDVREIEIDSLTAHVLTFLGYVAANTLQEGIGFG